MPTFKDVVVPPGQTITISGGKLNVPDNPIIPFIEGDGTGPDIWRASVRVFDAAVQKAERLQQLRTHFKSRVPGGAFNRRKRQASPFAWGGAPFRVDLGKVRLHGEPLC